MSQHISTDIGLWITDIVVSSSKSLCQSAVNCQNLPLSRCLKHHMSQDRLHFATVSERAQSIKLIEGILDTVADSVRTFHPSKSLAIISRVHDREIKAAQYFDTLPQHDDSGSEVSDNSPGEVTKESAVAEIDLVISGGGFKGYFMCGAAHVLTKELAKRNMRINRIGGTSAGAWAGLFICCGFTASHWMETYFACKDRPDGTIHEVYTDLVCAPYS